MFMNIVRFDLYTLKEFNCKNFKLNTAAVFVKIFVPADKKMQF